MSPIDAFLHELEASLRLHPRRRATVVAEVRDHFDDAVAHHLAAGMARDAAERQAVADFGPVATVAGPANAAAGTVAMRRAPLVAGAVGALVVVGLVLAAQGGAQRAQLTGARAVVGPVAFFAGAIAIELAFVSGLCAASRVLSSWRRAEAPSADRSFVLHHSARAAAFAGGAGGLWAISVQNGPIHQGGWRHGAVLGGLALIVGGLVLATLLLPRLRINRHDEATAGDAAPSPVLALGERAIAVVRRHPVPSCALVAVVAGAGAMSHAETSVLAALPWGIGQALAVVVGYVWLGPSLGLRARPRAEGQPAI
jgi:hypothetical protein